MSFRALGVGSGWVCAPQFCAITSGSTPKRAHHCGSLGAMHLAMMHPADRRELIADLATERPGLGEPHGHPN